MTENVKKCLEELASLSEFPNEETPETPDGQINRFVSLDIIKLAHQLLALSRLDVRCPNCDNQFAASDYPINPVSGCHECPECGYEGTNDQENWNRQFAKE